LIGVTQLQNGQVLTHRFTDAAAAFRQQLVLSACEFHGARVLRSAQFHLRPRAYSEVSRSTF